jgi:hypothetical protein
MLKCDARFAGRGCADPIAWRALNATAGPLHGCRVLGRRKGRFRSSAATSRSGRVTQRLAAWHASCSPPEEAD